MSVTEPGPDLHVVSLRYSLRPSDRVTYVNPPPLEFDTEDARFRLAEGRLTCEMKTHFATVEAARDVVQPILEAWEVDADLRRNRGELRFKFDGADIIDRAPLPPGVIRGNAYVVLPGLRVSAALGTVSVHVRCSDYPTPPPGTFRLNPDTESIFHRYQRYQDGHEPLPSMAYFCLTVLEAKVAPGKHRKSRAAEAYRIDKKVVKKMGDLSTMHGNRLTARKATATKPLTGSEGAWLEAAVKMLVWRLGDIRQVGALSLITMSDLPML